MNYKQMNFLKENGFIEVKNLSTWFNGSIKFVKYHKGLRFIIEEDGKGIHYYIKCGLMSLNELEVASNAINRFKKVCLVFAATVDNWSEEIK